MYIVSISAGSADVRLVNGASPCEGRVEIYHEGQWGTVCDDKWNLKDAAVVCRQLGCGSALLAPGGAHFGPGAELTWLDEVSCTGQESALKDCRSPGWRVEDCGHDEDAGVLCSVLYCWFVRLVNGHSLCSGRVEVNLKNTWTSVCDSDFDWQDAEVVCRELDRGAPSVIHRGAHFGRGQGPLGSEQFQCTGQESKLKHCPTAARPEQSCSQSRAVGLTCTGYTGFRLANGSDCSGQLELQYDSKWGTVCDQYWDLRDVSVLCQQLGCGEAIAAPRQAWFGQGSGPVWADVFECRGNESRLSHCAVSSWGRAVCSHGQDAGVICSALDVGVRLSGGERHCDGQVVVHYNSTWGRLLQHSWGYRKASMVCRELGCGSVVQIYHSSVYETGDSAVCLTGIKCSGDESHLVNCSSPHTVSCNTGQDVAQLCSAQRSLRLVGAGGDCAERLEVYHNGSWGTVCDDSWELADSQVVCRQLQCGTALSAPVPASFSQGTGPIWLDKVDCLGSESSLWECPSAGWGQHDCRHKEDVRILCSEVYYNGTWGSICANSMTDTTAAMICKQLGCGDKGTIRETNSRLSPDPKWLDFVSCCKHDSTLWQCPSSPWGQNDCTVREVANITCSGPRKEADRSTPAPQEEQPQLYCPVPLALRLAGGTNCSGQVELRYKGSWGIVCDDSWDLQDAQVVCRQLDCGYAVSAQIEASFGPGSGAIWLDEVNCCHSGLNQSNCRHKEDAGVTCTGRTRTTPQTQPLGGLSASPLVLLLLGALLFVVLALLVGQWIQNRKLRKALSKGALAPYHDAVYEEIKYKLAREGTYSAPRRGRFLSDNLPSGYDDVEDSEEDPASGDSITSLKEEISEYYDDAVTVPQTPDALSGELMSPVTEEAPEYYDDAVTVPQSPDTLSGELMSLVKEDAPEYYDDAISVPQSPVSGRLLSDETHSGYSDMGDSEGDPTSGVPHTCPGVDRVLPTLPSEEGAPAPDRTDYDDVGDESQGKDGFCETDRAVWEKLLLQV
ncbi:DMBT1 protein, partial [Atractosteus spatula]|nr:DMBT1 protein [Atractosteus spatula]